MTAAAHAAHPPPPMPSSSEASSSSSLDSPSLYDVFFDLPHPAASDSCERARIIDPPETLYPSDAANQLRTTTSSSARRERQRDAVASEMYDPENIGRVSCFAFPEFEGEAHAANQCYKDEVKRVAEAANLSGPAAPKPPQPNGAGLNRHDMYLQNFGAQHHTFALQLSDGTRVHGHVRRYLPTHADAKSRADVGRRGARAMVLLTRATGGERIYGSILKTCETVLMEANAVPPDLLPHSIPLRHFLHSLHRHHSNLCQEHAMVAAMGGSLYQAINLDAETPLSDGPGDSSLNSALKIARTFMEQNENLFKIQVSGVEFGGAPGDDNDNGRLGVIAGDYVRYHLPPPLQPGYVSHSNPEDMFSPILPLVRCLGAPHTLRLLSALLCERRVILVSRSTSRLSACVRGASSLLAQGLLVWRHIHIPVLPPRLLKYLSADAPYLIGLLEPYACNLETLGIRDVLCVNLDWNELRTFNMPRPAATIPDLLKAKRIKKSESVFNAAEFLAKDLDEILKADKRIWGIDREHGSIGVGGGGATAGGGIDGMAETIDGRSVLPGGGAGSTSSGGKVFGGLFHRRKNSMSGSSVSAGGGGETLSSGLHCEAGPAGHQDVASLFGVIMRAGRPQPGDDDESSTGGEAAANGGGDAGDTSVADGGHATLVSGGAECFNEEGRSVRPTIDAWDTCDDERGEEDIRAALVSFYLHFYGDLGMILSENPMDGSLWLDRRKFLLRKKQLGDKEGSPLFAVATCLSRSLMFEQFVRGRIAELERATREGTNILPHHVSLFALCEQYLRLHRLDFTISNVRRVVSRTVVGCPQHSIVESSEASRVKAMALTSNQPYEGNITAALARLVNDCRECNGTLCHVMAVVWLRLGEQRGPWKHILLALHLLKNLMLHGPLTVISEAMEGTSIIRNLRTYSSARSSESNRDVRNSAHHVYDLLMDRNRLFLRRRRVAIARTHQMTTARQRWADYLVRRLPVTVDFRRIHILLRPDPYICPTVNPTWYTVPDGDEEEKEEEGYRESESGADIEYEEDVLPVDYATRAPFSVEYEEVGRSTVETTHSEPEGGGQVQYVRDDDDTSGDGKEEEWGGTKRRRRSKEMAEMLNFFNSTMADASDDEEREEPEPWDEGAGGGGEEESADHEDDDGDGESTGMRLTVPTVGGDSGRSSTLSDVTHDQLTPPPPLAAVLAESPYNASDDDSENAGGDRSAPSLLHETEGTILPTDTERSNWEELGRKLVSDSLRYDGGGDGSSADENVPDDDSSDRCAVEDDQSGGLCEGPSDNGSALAGDHDRSSIGGPTDDNGLSIQCDEGHDADVSSERSAAAYYSSDGDCGADDGSNRHSEEEDNTLNPLSMGDGERDDSCGSASVPDNLVPNDGDRRTSRGVADDDQGMSSDRRCDSDPDSRGAPAGNDPIPYDIDDLPSLEPEKADDEYLSSSGRTHDSKMDSSDSAMSKENVEADAAAVMTDSVNENATSSHSGRPEDNRSSSGQSDDDDGERINLSREESESESPIQRTDEHQVTLDSKQPAGNEQEESMNSCETDNESADPLQCTENRNAGAHPHSEERPNDDNERVNLPKSDNGAPVDSMQGTNTHKSTTADVDDNLLGDAPPVLLASSVPPTLTDVLLASEANIASDGDGHRTVSDARSAPVGADDRSSQRSEEEDNTLNPLSTRNGE